MQGPLVPAGEAGGQTGFADGAGGVLGADGAMGGEGDMGGEGGESGADAISAAYAHDVFINATKQLAAAPVWAVHVAADPGAGEGCAWKDCRKMPLGLASVVLKLHRQTRAGAFGQADADVRMNRYDDGAIWSISRSSTKRSGQRQPEQEGGNPRGNESRG